MKSGEVELQGGIYDLETGKVEFLGRTNAQSWLVTSDASLPPSLSWSTGPVTLRGWKESVKKAPKVWKWFEKDTDVDVSKDDLDVAWRAYHFYSSVYMFRVNATWNSILAACHNAGTPNFDKKMSATAWTSPFNFHLVRPEACFCRSCVLAVGVENIIDANFSLATWKKRRGPFPGGPETTSPKVAGVLLDEVWWVESSQLRKK